MQTALQTSRTGWRISKAGKKYHIFLNPEKPACGGRMVNIFLAESVLDPGQRCKRCLRSLKRMGVQAYE